MQSIINDAEHQTAHKRIPVTEDVWKNLSNLKEPGQTYDQLLTKMIALTRDQIILDRIDEIEKTGHYYTLDHAAKELGIKIA